LTKVHLSPFSALLQDKLGFRQKNEKLFAMMDRDKDNVVSFNEFSDFVHVILVEVRNFCRCDIRL
jgi:hypothetical protein